MPERRIDPPVDTVGCTHTCVGLVVVLWVAAITLGVFGYTYVSNLLSK